MVILIPFFLIDLIKKLFGSNQNKGLARYTIFVILFNVIFGILWFYCRRVGVGFEIKGIWQKVLALNVLIWMMVMGKWLYKQDYKKLL